MFLSGFVLACVTVLGVIFFLRGSMLMEEQIKGKLQTAAAMAAMQFDPADIAKIQGTESLETPAFVDIVHRLQAIRAGIPEARFVYIMRRTEDPTTLQFVADADSLATDIELDTDGDGVVAPDEEASFPGDSYDITGIPALQGPAFDGPTVDHDFTTDQWGILLSGYAPIRDADGTTVAVLGMDMDARDYLTLSRRIFSPVAFSLLSILVIMLLSLIASFLRQRRIENLQQINRERSGLLLLAMHQIGSPLTIIRWSLEALTDELGKASGKLEDAVKEYAATTGVAVRQLAGILDNLNEASQVDDGTLRYQREWSSLEEVIAEVVKDIQPELQKRKLWLELSVDPTLRFSLDRKLIGGVLRELLVNAMTFSHEDGLIVLSARHEGKNVLVEVIDEGAGISKSDLPRIFDKFSRGTTAHLHQPNGNGLGLYIAKGIIKRGGGDIWIKTKEGQGTTVSFTLPE